MSPFGLQSVDFGMSALWSPLGAKQTCRQPRHAADQTAMRGRAAVEPVVDHLGVEHRMGRNYLVRPVGDAVPAVAGYNFGLLIRRLSLFAAAYPEYSRTPLKLQAI
jgi:hypothetical protein